eukprot:7020425-Lingulodinium_polyedra.AAC.1
MLPPLLFSPGALHPLRTLCWVKHYAAHRSCIGHGAVCRSGSCTAGQGLPAARATLPSVPCR